MNNQPLAAFSKNFNKQAQNAEQKQHHLQHPNNIFKISESR